jgi:hypothetical protein
MSAVRGDCSNHSVLLKYLSAHPLHFHVAFVTNPTFAF